MRACGIDKEIVTDKEICYGKIRIANPTCMTKSENHYIGYKI